MDTQQQDFKQAKQQSIAYNAAQDAPSDERLSAFELGQLWEGYMADSAAKCILQYFVLKPKILKFVLYWNTPYS